MMNKGLDFYFGDLMTVGLFRIDLSIEEDVLKGFNRNRNIKYTPIKAVLVFNLDRATFKKVNIYK